MYKQPPIWIINSTLFIFFICMLIFVMFTRFKIPNRAPLTTNYVPTAPLKDVSKIDISRIYRNDLFDTYKETEIETPQLEEKKLILPPPPPPKPAIVQEQKPIQFIEPLTIILKGIIYSSNEQYNRVIIEDSKSKNEKLYKVGDAIEDAEIIRIYYDKVMLIRSNGQQEILFVSSKDAQQDPLYKHEFIWQNIIKQKSETEFTIDREQFIKGIKNLAEFIDMLDVTTAFKKGKSVGCRIGVLKPDSVGIMLGLMPNDIIISIQNIPTTTTNDRVEIFTQIKNMNENDAISVKILRDNQEIIQSYSLITKGEAQDNNVDVPAKTPMMPQDLQRMHEMSNKLVVESQVSKNPLIEHVHKNNAAAMNSAPSAPSLLQQVPT